MSILSACVRAFTFPASTAASTRVELPEDEAEHLVRVLRLGVGDEVEVFDGRGGMWRAEVVHAGKKSAAIRAARARCRRRANWACSVTLVISVLKGDKMDDVVRDAVMLGVAAIQPVVSERAETSMAAMARSSRIARWQRIAVSSAKQCGARGGAADSRRDAARLVLEREDRPRSRLLCVEPSAALGDVRSVRSVAEAVAPCTLIVGPEGGWSVTEVAAAHDSGAILMSLGSRTLRADAVPIVALTALLTTWGEM